ncbi:MAG: tRNA(Ser) Um(44) 2'-O-methyltransferase [Thelocarpon impressellum]|nr:MAG: tRNA(Ser) Um(44) 2'-O-methyltransferase [Thelocarpon impressellum]
MPFEPTDLTLQPQSTHPSIASHPPEQWLPALVHPCAFSANLFEQVMLNLIKNPNVTSSHLFRADILHDTDDKCQQLGQDGHEEREMQAEGYEKTRTMVRRLIPRNPTLDRALLQTCHFYRRTSQGADDHLVIYIPHASSPSCIPWYHPPVRGLAFLYSTAAASVSIQLAPFPQVETSPRLHRTLHHLLAVVHKHGTGLAAGYVKRTHHDLIIPQAAYQDTYTRLKAAHAARLIAAWAESTDPTKHVFEDLGIAAFLVELWRGMYSDRSFPGFVDIGCGNGVLVDILLREGWPGSGIDARQRKSWSTFSAETRSQLSAQLIVPAPIAAPEGSFHDGVFPAGTFLISNHADELTGWTPLLAALSASPFLAIPCCSHDLGGAKFRAPSSANPGGKQPSAYAALVAWVGRLAETLGFEVRREMLRIPSTRNAALLGTFRGGGASVAEVLDQEGGGAGWVERVTKLESKSGGH